MSPPRLTFKCWSVCCLRTCSGDPPLAYREALQTILESDFTRILVIEEDGAVIGSLQLTLAPNLSYVGQARAIFENMHVLASHRGKGAGAALVQYAIEAARRGGAGQIVLTSSNSRRDPAASGNGRALRPRMSE